jgi:hypothetical protein
MWTCAWCAVEFDGPEMDLSLFSVTHSTPRRTDLRGPGVDKMPKCPECGVSASTWPKDVPH